MDRSSKIALPALAEEVQRMVFRTDDSGTLMAQRQSTQIREKDFRAYPLTWQAIMEISRLLQRSPMYLMINQLPAGVSVPKHTDTLKRNNEAGKMVIHRWHLPLVTNPLCRYWEEGFSSLGIHLPAGQWYGPVQYWKEHSIWNGSNENRIHLVVDLE